MRQVDFKFYCMATGRAANPGAGLTLVGRDAVVASALANLHGIPFDAAMYDGGNEEEETVHVASSALALGCPCLAVPVHGLTDRPATAKFWQTAEDLAAYRRTTPKQFLFRYTQEGRLSGRMQALLLGSAMYLLHNDYFRDQIRELDELNVLMVAASPGPEMGVGNPEEIHMLAPADIVLRTIRIDAGGFVSFDLHSEQFDCPTVT